MTFSGLQRASKNPETRQSCSAIYFFAAHTSSLFLSSLLQYRQYHNVDRAYFDMFPTKVWSLCVFTSKGKLEQVQLSVPSVVVKNKAINLTTMLRPSNVGTVTYFWWFDNKTEVSLVLPFSTKTWVIWMMNSLVICLLVLSFSLWRLWREGFHSPSPRREVILSQSRRRWETRSFRTKWPSPSMVNRFILPNVPQQSLKNSIKTRN